MNKRFKALEETFNMDSVEDDKEYNEEVEGDPVTEEGELPTTEELASALENAKNLEKQFKQMDHYDVHDKEMDELAKMAVEAHQSLQDLGMNVEIRHAGEIFSSSSQMLKIAVDAKNSKVEKKLKLLKLQLEKMKMDRAIKKDDNSVDGTAVKLDRNQLLDQLRNMNKDD